MLLFVCLFSFSFVCFLFNFVYFNTVICDGGCVIVSVFVKADVMMILIRPKRQTIFIHKINIHIASCY